MSKVTLLAINAKYVHSSLAVWVVAGGVSKYARLPHDVEVVETTIRQSCLEIAGQAVTNSPDVVGISTYIWNAGKLPGLIKILRELLPGVVIVLGGPEASNNAAYWLGNGADYVMIGEGEHSFPALLDSLDGAALPIRSGHEAPRPYLSGAAPYDPSFCDGSLTSPVPQQASEPSGRVQADQPVDPYSDAYFNALGGRIAYIETSRGCPFKCAFCLSGGTGVRFFPMEPVKEQTRKLSNSGTRTIKFVDRTFNCDAGRAYEILEYVISLDTKCTFHFEVAADLFDERTLSLLTQALPGRIQLEAGLQSFYKPALIASSREIDQERAEKNLREILRGQNIHVHVDLIAGLPYETLTDFQNSFDRAYALGAHTLQLGFLKLLHGSALREQADELGIRYDAAPPYEIKGSPWLSAEDIHILKQAENALQHTYNKSRFLLTLEYVLSKSGGRPFSVFSKLGAAVQNHGMQLQGYAERLFSHFGRLPGVDERELREHMTCDWLGMTKGENMPPVLKTWDKRRADVAAAAKNQLGRGIRREETVVLPSGRGVFVDSENRDPVTGLYRLHFL